MKNIVLMAILAIFLIGCGRSMGKYSNDEYGFSIDFPADWDTSKVDPRMVFMALEPFSDSADIFQEGFSVSVFENEGYALDEIVSENIALTERYYKDAKIERKDTKINDVEAIQLTLDYDMQELSLTNIATFVNHDGYLFTITQSAEKKNFSAYEELFDELIHSLEFNE
ncbi:MAG: PsbP-related protein [Crocinitomicaceae bacterium]